MHSSFQTEQLLFWVIFLFFINLHSMASSSGPRISQAGLFCGNFTPTQGTNVVPAFVEDMEHLSVLLVRNHSATHFSNVSMPTYALSQCHQDLSPTDCLLCFAAARTKLPRCLPSVSARIYLDGCFLRYENYSFYQESTDPIRDTVNCSSGSVSVDQNAEDDFAKAVGYAVENATRIAVSNGGFGVTEEKGVYVLGQCWGTVTGEKCEECLVKAGKELRKCAPSRNGRGLNVGCYMRYSTEKFYNDAGETNTNDGSSATGYIVIFVLAAAACIMFSFFAAYAGYARVSKLKGGINLHRVSIGLDKSNLHFKYETLEKATNYFSPSRKLGQGGAGSVYKGTLPGGKVVAVKRLVFNTRQWVDDFFNEVNLISGIQHKNLVSLLGCSIEGPESLLVYEYVPNKSLDHHLFAKNKTQVLNWKQRFDIILGTAEGLAYLHGECKVRIIHRDIKSSNVLLDNNLIPKIADFGLARCFGSDKTHLSTGIAGTLGYMAPEYLVRGQLTEKADVYSYGVLVLEIVYGRRNSSFIEDANTLSLLQMVWKLYKSNNMLEAVDKSLRDDFLPEEVLHVLRVGLLCTQASVSARPSMAQVVDMLNKKELEIPEATQPPFLNASSLMATNSNRFSSSNSFISSAARKIADSYTTSDYSSMQSSDRKSGMEELL